MGKWIQMEFNYWNIKGVDIIAWLIIFIVTFIIEITTMSLVTIWFSAGALAAMAVKYVGFYVLGQIIVFIVTSILTFLLFRPVLMKHIRTPRIKTNADSLVGKTGEVVKDITPLSFGQVKVNSQVWTAKAIEEIEIKRGTIVEILEIEGVKLIVKEKEGGNVECSGSY